MALPSAPSSWERRAGLVNPWQVVAHDWSLEFLNAQTTESDRAKLLLAVPLILQKHLSSIATFPSLGVHLK